MANCETQLWALVAEIEPTKAQKEGASTSHNYLRSLLDEGQFGKRIIRSFLSGSYARDTAIRPIDDVDVVFVVDPAGWQGLRIGLPTPEKILESFANAIRYRYPVSSVYGQRRSVRLQLNHLDIDVVPAVQDPGNSKHIWIPDVDTGNWLKSAPQVQMELATSINTSRAGRFKPLVKVLKYWNSNLPSTTKFKSFSVETIATHVFKNIAINSVQEGLLLFFDFVAYAADKTTHYKWASKYNVNLQWMFAQVPDASGSGTNVVQGLLEDRREKFVAAAVRSRDRMNQARDTLNTDTAIARIREALHT